MRVAVLGATGFVGSALVPVLRGRGHEVVAVTRHPREDQGPAVYGDLDDPATLAPALQGCDAAYLLVHALGSPDFAQREKAQAQALAAAAELAGLRQLVYLGGLGRGDDDLSPHLRSRREVEHVLRAGSVPVTALRAGILVGRGSAGWEMLRQIVDALPVLVMDARSRTRQQPIAVHDAVAWLADVLDEPSCLGQVLEIGGSDVLTYGEMAARVADLRGARAPRTVPWVPDAVAAAGVQLLTDVDGLLAQDLLASMSCEAVVTDGTAQRLLPREVLGFDEAARRALS